MVLPYAILMLGRGLRARASVSIPDCLLSLLLFSSFNPTSNAISYQMILCHKLLNLVDSVL